MLKRIIPFAHETILKYITSDSVCVDMTIGNGLDTLFLAQHAKRVIGFDIQDQAIRNTTKLLEEHALLNVTLIKTSHENIKDYVTACDCVVFNLGYLPSSDKVIKTTFTTTYQAIVNALEILNPHGLISITVYPGHEEGMVESEQLMERLQEFSSKEYNILIYKFINKAQSPYNIFIEKSR